MQRSSISRFSFLPTFPNEFVNIPLSSLLSLLSFSCSIFLYHDRLVTPSVSNHSSHSATIPSSNISFFTIYSFITHAFKYRLFLFSFFLLFFAFNPIPFLKPIFIPPCKLHSFPWYPLAVHPHFLRRNFIRTLAN